MISIPSLVGAPAGASLAVAPNLARATVAVGGGGTTPPPTPAPSFTVQPSIAPSGGSIGQSFTGSSGTLSNGTVVGRRWLLNGVQVSTASIYVSTAAGSLVYEVTATGPGGTTVATSMGVAVLAAATGAVSSFSATKTRTAMEVPALMASNYGPYYPCLKNMSGVASFPYKWACYFSSDHDGGNVASGIYLYLTNDADPALADWISYDAAVTAGKFDYLATKPTANPIVHRHDVNGSSIETPWVEIYNGVVTMFVQQNDGSGGRNQSTMRCTSADGIQFTTPTLLLNLPSNVAFGDGHTGYFRCAPNPFPALINPATGVKWRYVGYGLIGGSDRSVMAQWASDGDPQTGTWTLTAMLQKIAGRAMDAIPGYALSWNTIDVNTARVVPQGVSVLMGGSTEGSGAVPRYANVYEVLLDTAGQQVIAPPIPVIARGAAGSFDFNEVDQATIGDAGTSWAILYQGVNSANKNQIGAATSPKRDLTQTNFPPFAIPNPSTYLRRSIQFNEYQAVPSLTTLVARGTVAPTFTYVTNGVQSTLDATTPTPGEAYFFDTEGFVPEDCEMVEFWVDAMMSVSSSGFRVPYIGMAAAKDFPANQTDMIWFDNGGGTEKLCYKNYMVGGVATRAVSVDYFGFGYGGFAQVTPSSGSPKSLGFRWFPQQNRLIMLGQGRGEFEELAIPASWDKTKRLYPFFGTKADQNLVEQVKMLSVHVAPKVKALRDVTLSGTKFNAGTAAGTFVGRVLNRWQGSTITVDNPRLAIASDGARVVVGNTAATAGTFTANLTETHPLLGSRTTALTFTVAQAAVTFLSASFTGTEDSSYTIYQAETGGIATAQSGYAPSSVSRINGNRLTSRVSGSVYKFGDAVPPSANYYVEADCVCAPSRTSQESSGVIGRADPSSQTLYTFHYSGGNTAYRLLAYYGSNTAVVLGTFSSQFLVNETHKLRLSFDGAKISCSVDGVTVISVTDANGDGTPKIPGPGRAGTFMGGAQSATAGIHLDNLVGVTIPN